MGLDYDIIDEDELVRDTTIDRHNLEEHWEEQTTIHNKWSKRLRQAQRLLNKYATDYRLLKAELFKRGRAGEYDFEGSMTDAALKNWIEDHPEFKKALRKRNKYQAIVDNLFGVMYTINQRKESLENERSLLLGGIYSSPKMGHKQKEVYERQASEKENRELNKRMKARTKRKKKSKKL